MTSSNHTHRVLMIIPFLRHIGGMEKQSLRLAKELNKQGVHVSFLTTARVWQFFGRNSARIVDTIEGFRVITIPGIYVPIMKNFPLEFLAWGMLYIWKNRKAITILHGHQLFSSGVVVGAATRAFGIPSLVKLARSGEQGDVDDILHHPFRKRKLFYFQSITRFVAMTDAFVEDIQRISIPDKKIIKIPNGVDTHIFTPPSDQEKKSLRQKLQIPTDRAVVLLDSRLSPSKRPEFVLQAWNIVHADRPKALLLIIGRGGIGKTLPRHLTDYIKKNGLEDAVQIRAIVEHIEEYDRAADVFTLGSREEGLSNALLQAAATGLGIAVTNIAGNRAVIQHEKTGLLADVDDAGDLAQKLRTLIDDPRMRRTLGQAARRHIEEQFSLSSVAQRYVELYKSISA